MEKAANKVARLAQIEGLLVRYPAGLTQAEIARYLHVHRSTVGRYLPDLPAHIYLEDDGRWKIDRRAYLVSVRLSLHEALALHLGARLMTTCMDKHSTHAAGALRKLGLALERLAPRIATHLEASAALMDDENRRHDPVYMTALETLTEAWSVGRKVWVKYQSSPEKPVQEYLYAPYFIEPYAIGHSSYVFGWSEPPGELRTLKIERIRAIRIEGEPYEIPPEFNVDRLLADAWGIWYSDDDPVEVVLCFNPRVVSRVRETQWHSSETLRELADGSLLWRAHVAEPQEMLPWIRGWGPDAEVIAPAGLRDRIAEEMKAAAELYT